jgi:hypothetical protein
VLDAISREALQSCSITRSPLVFHVGIFQVFRCKAMIHKRSANACSEGPSHMLSITSPECTNQLAIITHQGILCDMSGKGGVITPLDVKGVRSPLLSASS